jgi:hypothetical protein
MIVLLYIMRVSKKVKSMWLGLKSLKGSFVTSLFLSSVDVCCGTTRDQHHHLVQVSVSRYFQGNVDCVLIWWNNYKGYAMIIRYQQKYLLFFLKCRTPITRNALLGMQSFDMWRI